MPQLEDYLAVCEAAARSAGQKLLEFSGKVTAREKGPGDLVTEADLAAQAIIVDTLQSAFPSHGLLGEEGLDRPGGPEGFRWIIDPLDGTTNYVHGVPNYAVS